MISRRYQFKGAALGVATTLAITTAFAFGLFDRAEYIALDMRQQKFNSLATDPRIVHVDIDDNSIEKIGRWPDFWPRDLIADLIRLIATGGARAVAVDLLFDEPQVSRYDDPLAQHDPRLEGHVGVTGTPSAENIVYPDAELADAIRRAGNVYLSMRFALAPSPTARVREYMRAHLHASPADVASDLKLPAGMAARAWARVMLSRRLQSDFTLDRAPDELAAAWRPIAETVRVSIGELTPDAVLAGAKRDAAEVIVAAVLEHKSDAILADVLDALQFPPDRFDSDRNELKRALERGLAIREVLAKTPAWPAGVSPERFVTATELQPPVWALASAAKSMGAVAVEKDGDGYLRRVPLLVRAQGHVLRQLGFAVAADALGLDAGLARSLGGDKIALPSADAQSPQRVPLDGRGRLVLHWSRSGRWWRQGGDVAHIPAAWLLEVSMAERDMRSNERNADRLADEVVVATKQGTVTGPNGPMPMSQAYEDKVLAWRASSRTLHTLTLAGQENTAESRAMAARVAAMANELQAERSTAAMSIKLTQKEVNDALRDLEKGEWPLRPGETKEQARAALEKERDASGGLLVKLDEADKLRRANEALRKRIERRLPEIRAKLTNKFVFVGYTATAEGDIVPTAIDPEMPGVIAHATVLNDFLQGRFIWFPRLITEMLLVLVCGVAITLITATRGYLGTAAIVGSAIAGFGLVNSYAVFQPFDIKLELAAPLFVMGGAAIVVTFFRWRTADQQKREIRTQLGQYTSPALANSISDDPNVVTALTRVESRPVTCFVSDLKGFTTMAEQIDPERTRAVLNVYLDRMSEVLHKHEALINKFMGDGIFAFFNSTVLPKEHHQREACEAAIECMRSLEALREESRRTGGDELIQQFQMRVGLASGVAGVGDFGSTRKKDYTIIGDVANLAARLEPANKVFGTSLMVSGPTRDVVSELYEFRYLAELQVKGKYKTVPVYELMGRKGAVPEDQLKYATRFSEGVELYKQRRWDDCVVHFSRMLARNPDDSGAAAYIDASEEKKMFPPNEKWVGALELKEK